MQLIGLDIGTTSVAGVAFDVDAAEVRRCISVPNLATIKSADSFSQCQDAEEIVRIVGNILHQLLLEDPDTRAIGISSQMHGILYVNQIGYAVSPLYTWQDGRGNEPMSDSLTYAQHFSQETGYRVATGYGMVTHYYHVVNRQVPVDAMTLSTIGDYVAMRLARMSRPLIDSTQAASLGVYSVIDGSFDEASLARVNIDAGFLPTVAQSQTTVGFFRGRIPVCTAIGDNQASFLGTVKAPESSLLVNVGTGAQLSISTDSPVVDIPGFELRPLPSDGRFLLVGATLSGGKSYALVEAFFRQVLEMFGQPSEDLLFDRMEFLLSQVHAVHHPMDVSPHFYGTRQMPEETGRIGNLSPDNFTPLHLMDGVLRGVAHELRSLYINIPTFRRDRVQEVIGSGNAIRKSPYFASIVEHVFGSPIELPAHDEEAALGAALHAGTTVGVYQSCADASANLAYVNQSEK